MFFVYVLKSLKDGRRYTGYTGDLGRRVWEHNEGLVKSTWRRKPLELEYYEEFENKRDALIREKFFKTGQGREFLRRIGL